jgi:lysozyme
MDPNAFPFGLTEPEAAKILAEDLRQAEQAVTRLVKVPLTQGQFDALVDFVFNLGAGRLTTSSLLRMLNASRYEDAAEHLLQWDHAGGRELAALKARRQAEVDLWHSPALPAENLA